MPHLIDNSSGKPVGYESVLIPPDKLTALHSRLSLSIIKELASEPGCAMDLARKLEQHEQKIYYHLKKLEDAGIVKQMRTEKRCAMTAKIYSVVSPVVAARIFEGGGEPVKKKAVHVSPKVKKFLEPFIKDGEMNALVVLGDPYPHGEFDYPARGSVHAFDFAMLMGTMLHTTSFPHYKLDTDVTEEDMKKNLILFNSPKANMILHRVNEHLPIRFEGKDEWMITSTYTGKSYDDPRAGLIVKWDSPLEPGKKILVIGGIRTRGVKAAVLALTKYFDKVYESVRDDGNLACVVQGLDKSGHKVIDSIRILE